MCEKRLLHQCVKWKFLSKWKLNRSSVDRNSKKNLEKIELMKSASASADILYTPFNPADIELKSVDLSIGRALFGIMFAL